MDCLSERPWERRRHRLRGGGAEDHEVPHCCRTTWHLRGTATPWDSFLVLWLRRMQNCLQGNKSHYRGSSCSHPKVTSREITPCPSRGPRFLLRSRRCRHPQEAGWGHRPCPCPHHSAHLLPCRVLRAARWQHSVRGPSAVLLTARLLKIRTGIAPSDRRLNTMLLLALIHRVTRSLLLVTPGL